MSSNIQLFNTDCMEAMASMKDKQFDLAIVDPPYGIGADEAQNDAALSRIKANGLSKAGRGWKLYKDSEWDKSIPSEYYWQELFRTSKEQIVFGGNYTRKEYFYPTKHGMYSLE